MFAMNTPFVSTIGVFMNIFTAMDISKEASLIKQLMTGYDSMIRPANSTSPAVVVALGLAMTEIVSLVSKTQNPNVTCTSPDLKRTETNPN